MQLESLAEATLRPNNTHNTLSICLQHKHEYIQSRQYICSMNMHLLGWSKSYTINMGIWSFWLNVRRLRPNESGEKSQQFNYANDITPIPSIRLPFLICWFQSFGGMQYDTKLFTQKMYHIRPILMHKCQPLKIITEKDEKHTHTHSHYPSLNIKVNGVGASTGQSFPLNKRVTSNLSRFRLIKFTLPLILFSFRFNNRHSIRMNNALLKSHNVGCSNFSILQH